MLLAVDLIQTTLLTLTDADEYEEEQRKCISIGRPKIQHKQYTQEKVVSIQPASCSLEK